MMASINGAADQQFPVRDFARLVVLGGYYRGNTRVDYVGSGESFFGIPMSAIREAELADIVTCVSRAFSNRTRHGLRPQMFRVWLAMEFGILIEASGWRYAFPEKARRVFDDVEAARHFHLAPRTCEEYRNAMGRAFDDEWSWMMNRERLAATG